MRRLQSLVATSAKYIGVPAVLLLLAAACAGTVVETSAEREPASTTQPVASQEAPISVAVETGEIDAEPAEDEPVAPPPAATTGEPADEPTPEAVVIPPPADDKNQPVFRQARVDGDGPDNPTQIAVGSEPVLAAGEVSALTDRVDVYRLDTDVEVGELMIGWMCSDLAALDNRPLRMRVEDRGVVTSEFVCQQAGQAGTVRIPVGADSSLLLFVDSNPLDGQTGSNFFASYEAVLTVVDRSVARAESSPDEADGPTPTPAQPTATSEPDATPEPTATSEPDATPEPTATSEPDATPEPTATSGPTAAPEPTPTANTDPTPPPEPTPTPTPGVVATRPAPVGDDEEPAIGNGQVAPNDGDSRTNPQFPEQAGFLLGSVSAPTGDRSDWSSFTVGPSDPTNIFAGVFCENFSSPDGSGTLTVTVFEDTTPKVTLTCTAAMTEAFSELTFVQGQTYFVEATFSGSGYTDWFFQAGDDD